jgi:hypothetical protein
MPFSHLGDDTDEAKFQGTLQAEWKVTETKRRKPYRHYKADVNELGYAYS